MSPLESRSGKVVAGSLSTLLDEIARAPPVALADGWDRALRPGAIIGRFELLRELGRGAFGIVFEARDVELNRRVAFKAIRPGTVASGKDPAWLRAEAEAIARLNHPNIVTLFDVGRCDSGPYLILELLSGETLAQRLTRGALEAGEAVRVALDIAAGLAHAHGAGVVHRDLKPSNVLLTESGGAKILDFGLAHVFGRGGLAGGTLAFMAPEQRRGEPADPRADVYAAGVVLHLMITGVLPDAGARNGALVPSISWRIPAPVRAALPRLLHADPARRPADGREVLAVLEEAADEMARRPIPTPPPRESRRWIAAVAAVGVAVVTAAVAGLAWRSRGTASTVTVAVADLENVTGEADLDGLSGMLVTSLEQSARVHVVPRSRITAVAAAAGREWNERLDEADAREVAGRAGAVALLAGTVERTTDSYLVELRATAVEGGELVFAFGGRAARREDIPGVLDALAGKVRAALRENADEVKAAHVNVGEALTANLEAYGHYFAGQRCLERPGGGGQDCAADLERAAAADPAFALPHYSLAVLAHDDGDEARVRAEMALAVRAIERVPAKERRLVLAYQARLEGRVDDAVHEYDALVARHPDDREALFLAGDLLHHARRPADAVERLRRVTDLDPLSTRALEHLVADLGALGRRGELRELVERTQRAAPTPSPAVAGVLAAAYAWLGESERAVRIARRSAMRDDGVAGLPDVARALAFAGRLSEAEAVLRRATAQRAFAAHDWIGLASVLMLQGRRNEALDTLRIVDAQLSNTSAAPMARARRASFLVGAGRPADVVRACESVQLPAQALAPCTIGLALAGETAKAREFAAGLAEGSATAAAWGAIEKWSGRDVDGAIRDLRAMEEREPLPIEPDFAPSWLLGEICAAEGRDREALDALDRFGAMYVDPIWRAWAWPRSLYVRAVAAARLRDVPRARGYLRTLLDGWRGADRDLPLLADARALDALLASGASPAGLSPPPFRRDAW